MHVSYYGEGAFFHKALSGVGEVGRLIFRHNNLELVCCVKAISAKQQCHILNQKEMNSWLVYNMLVLIYCKIDIFLVTPFYLTVLLGLFQAVNICNMLKRGIF